MFLRGKSHRKFGLVKLITAMKRSVIGMPPTYNCISTVTLGVFNFPFATILSNSGRGPSFKIVCGASNRILHQSAFKMAFVRAPVSRRPSNVNFPKSVEKYNIPFSLSTRFSLIMVGNSFFFRDTFEIKEYFVCFCFL